MKRYCSLVLIFVYMVSSVEFQQLMKLPNLMEHFVEHKSKDQQLSFVEFIYKHYSEESPEDFQVHKDRKLPFKVLENNVTFVAHTLPFVNYCFDAMFIENNVKKSDETKYNQFFISSYLSKIWQPPKNS